ncbi:hypothetical protein Dimus_018598, partial [Dionaea muscipula]
QAEKPLIFVKVYCAFARKRTERTRCRRIASERRARCLNFSTKFLSRPGARQRRPGTLQPPDEAPTEPFLAPDTE